MPGSCCYSGLFLTFGPKKSSTALAIHSAYSFSFESGNEGITNTLSTTIECGQETVCALFVYLKDYMLLLACCCLLLKNHTLSHMVLFLCSSTRMCWHCRPGQCLVQAGRWHSSDRLWVDGTLLASHLSGKLLVWRRRKLLGCRSVNFCLRSSRMFCTPIVLILLVMYRIIFKCRNQPYCAWYINYFKAFNVCHILHYCEWEEKLITRTFVLFVNNCSE